MLSDSQNIRRVFTTPRLSVAVFVIAAASYFSNHHFSDSGLSPCFVLPVLVGAFAIRQVQYWPVTALWAGLGLISAMLVMELLGIDDHYASIGTPHSILTDIVLGALKVGTDLALAAGLAWMGLLLSSVTHDENGVISKIDIENIFTWRLFAFFVALPLAIYLMRSIEAAVSASLLSVDINTWSLIQSDLLGYFIMLPAVTGAVLALIGVPRLEPDLKPIWAYVLGYITLVVGLCAAIAFSLVVFEPSTLMPLFAFIALLGMFFPTMHIAGRLLLVNFAGLFFASSNGASAAKEIFPGIIAFSLGTLIVMLLRLIAQIKMNRAQEEKQAALERSETFLRAGTGAFAVYDRDINLIYASEPLKDLLETSDDGFVRSMKWLYHGYTHAEIVALKTRVQTLPDAELIRDEKLYEIITAQGTLRKLRINRRWFEDPATHERLLSTSYRDITEQMQLEAERVEQESILNAFVFGGPQYCFVEDENFKIVLISEAAAQLYGNRPASEMIGLDTIDFLSNTRKEFLRAARQTRDERLLAGETVTSKTPLIMEQDGKTKRFEISVKLIRQTDKGLLRGIILNDVTEVYNALKAANTFLDSQLTAVTIQREDFSWYYISDAFREQLGISSIEDLKDPANGFWENRDEAAVLEDREMLRALPTGVLHVNPDPFVFVTAAGERLYFKVQNKWIDNPSGEGRLLLNSAENITELLAQQQRIQDQADALEQQKHALEIQAQTDPLTGLLNRLGLNDQLQIMEGVERDQDLAVYLLDVDFFKSVNDTYSHREGDDLLIAIGKTLRDVSQKNAIVARLGGEEFLVATPWIDAETAKDFGSTLRRAVGETQIQSEGHTVSRTTSVGIAKLSRTDSLDAALSLADLALSEAKARGRNLDILVDEAFHTEMEARGAFITETEIDKAIIAGEFCYFLQPIFNTEGNFIEGFEAFIRWIIPDGRSVSPELFISKFQKIFYKPEFLRTRQEMRQMVINSLKDHPTAYITWNFNIEQFVNDDFIELVKSTSAELLDGTAHTFVFEISEKAIKSDYDLAKVIPNLEKLRDAGYQIALDDFGTVQSNIHRLTQIPIDILKIDKSLIKDIGTDHRKQSTVRAINYLAQSLGIKCIAEGVSTNDEARLLFHGRIVSQQGTVHGDEFTVGEVQSGGKKFGAKVKLFTLDRETYKRSIVE